MKNLEKYINNFSKEVFTEENNSTENISFAPLGAWVNLTIFAKSLENEFTEEQSENIELSLGMSIDDSFEKLKELYRGSPEFISFAIAFWKKTQISEFSEHLYKRIMNTVELLSDNKKITITKNHLPTQDEIDTWVNENSKGIIKDFPEDVNNPDLEAIIANIIAVKIDWNEPYESKTSPKEMHHWNVDEVLFRHKDNSTKLYKDESGKIFGIHSSRKTYQEEKSFIEVSSIIGETDNTEELYAVLNDFLNERSNLTELNFDDLENLNIDFANVEFREEMTSHPTINYDIYYPAWDVAYKRDLNVSKGFDTIVQSFKNLEEEKEVLNYQVVNSSYHKIGYEAAALTYGMILRAAAMIPSQVAKNAYVSLFFNKPFVSITQIEEFHYERKEWFPQPLFISKIVKATDSKE